MSRELALKTLFQIDVGKHAVDDSLDQAMRQVCRQVSSAIGQIANEGAEAALAHNLPTEAEISMQSKRALRGAARAVAAELRALEERAGERCREALYENGTANVEEVAERFAADAREILERIRNHVSRPTLYPRFLEALAVGAEQTVKLAGDVFLQVIESSLKVGEYAAMLIRGASEKRDEIDQQISAHASGWSFDRLAAVDRNILRLAAYELLYVAEITAGIAINEAVELAHRYSTEESGRFVNGVLGALASEQAA
jgi:N utilization substance protein B